MIWETEKLLTEGLLFFTYLLISSGLIQTNVSKRSRLMLSAGALSVAAALQLVLLLSGQNGTLLLTLLPLTAYLPVSVGLHLLSKHKFFQTAAAFMVGAQVVFTLRILDKILKKLTSMQEPLLEGGGDILILVVLFLAAALFVFVTYRFLRKPFCMYAEQNRTNWILLCFPATMLVLLFSYFSSSTTNITILVLLLITSVSVFLIAAKILASSAQLAQMREAKAALSLQVELQKQEYERVCQKNEWNRIYRHDTRHHLAVLEKLARQNDVQMLLEYIAKLDGQLSAIGLEQYCENPVVNAVLSAGIEKASEQGCHVETRMVLPKEIPFEETDLCVALANALENAVNACAKIAEEEKRVIRAEAELIDDSKLVIAMSNPFTETILFDADGVPMTQQRGEHGIGLKSIRAIADKYNGCFRCECRNGEFKLKLMLFAPQKEEAAEEKRKYGVLKKLISSFSASVVAIFFMAGFMPEVAQALEQVAPLKEPVRVAKTVFSGIGWGDTAWSAKRPVFEGADAAAAERLNKTAEDYLRESKERFLWYAMRKYEGYVNAEVSHKILRDDERLFCVQFSATINAGSSIDYNRCIVYDKQNEKTLALEDFFLEGSSYVETLSREILQQMTEQNAAGEANYFVSGGMWPEESCFRAISADQNFYVDSQNRLVILFEQYEVAPGSAGTPEFVIETQTLQDILRDTALLE